MSVVMGFDLEQFAAQGSEASIEHSISCAVTQLTERVPGLMTGVEPEPWFTASGGEWGLQFSPLTSPQDAAAALTPDKVMNSEGLAYLVEELVFSTKSGVPIVTWHGAAYDFPCLALHAGMYEEMQIVALESIDLHVLFMAVKRHRLGLKAAAEAVGSYKGGGANGVSDGAEALTVWPDRWTDVLAYCAQDVKATLDVYQHLVKYGGFAWTSKKGKLMQFVLPPSLRDPSTWTVRNLLTQYPWTPADKWITEPASPDDDVFKWLFVEPDSLIDVDAEVFEAAL